MLRTGRGNALAAGAARPFSGVVRTLFLISVLVLFTVSGSMLWLLGYNYDGLAGSAATKIHPGTYLVLLTFALAIMAEGNPVRSVVAVVGQRPASLFLLAVAAVVLAQTTYRSAPGMAGIVDSYMLAAFVSALIVMADRTTRDRTETIIHAALISNAVLALVEFGTKQLFFPYRFDGEEFPNDTRSTALQGHPLIGAILTSTYILALRAGGGRLSTPVRAGVILLEAMALVAFGGRSAIVTCALLAGAASLVAIYRILRSGKVPLLGLAVAVLVLTMAPVAAAGLAAGGFFDAILGRFVSDGGSANARVEMVTLLQRIPLGDLVIGPDPEWVDSLRRASGLDLGIENPIVKTVLYQGIIVACLLILAVGWFCYEIARASRRGLLLPMLGFFIVVNTFESLATKSTLLAKFAVMMLILFRPDRSRQQHRTSAKVARPQPLESHGVRDGSSVGRRRRAAE